MMNKPGIAMPVTRLEEYMCAILDEMRAIHAILAQDGPPEVSAFVAADEIQLREPKPVRRRKSAPGNGTRAEG